MVSNEDWLLFEVVSVGEHSNPFVELLWLVFGSTIANKIIDKLTLNIYKKHVHVNNITHITARIGTPPETKEKHISDFLILLLHNK